MKRQALGKGLDVLLPQPPGVPMGEGKSDLLKLSLGQIHPNPLQPRLSFQEDQLEELAASIRENGVIQPIVVRRSGGEYEIVAGERRWRAAKKAGLEKIPAIILNVSDEKMLEMALVENIQRAELSPIEEAHAYHLLISQFDLTQEEVARRVGRSRAAVTNALRLLQLPEDIQRNVVQGELSMGHARALVPLAKKDQLELAQQIIRLGLSVRSAERRARQLQGGAENVRPRPDKDPDVLAAENRLENHWKARAEIQVRKGRGRISLYFHSQEDLDQLFLGLLSCPPQ